ncbi:MAG: hypothetical protein NT062_07665 [Proteobacteria bacterium]|nr:hypothetical protein [Pseudomonadota bacterium]
MTKAILLAALLGSACTVGEFQGNVTGAPDAAGNDQVDAPAGGVDAPAALACITRGTPGVAHAHGGGVTHAGESCVVAGCHLNGQTGGGAPAFQFAGTLYKPGGVNPDPGGVVVAVPDDPAKPPIKMVADSAGNFHSGAPAQGQMPASTYATACDTSPTPTLGHQSVKLNGQSTPGKGGDCNGCHGGTQGAMVINP